MKKRKIYWSVLVGFLIFSFVVQSVAAENQVIVDFYYSKTCGACHAYVPIIENITAHYAENYSGTVIIQEKDVGENATYRKEMHDRGVSYPSVVVNNETKIPKANLTYDNLIEVIDAYVAKLDINHNFDNMILYLPIIGKVDLSSFSLPVFTIVLGGLDSFNPCSFFILIFLLNLLLYLRSKRRMLLVGCIFIFFSGFFYFLFMFVLFNVLFLTATYISIISLIAGIIAVAIGIFNIKEFFFFKKGPSLNIPEEKRDITFKRMRKLVKAPSLLAMLGGTIFLAVTVNFYELLCTLGFPLIFTSRLTELHLPLMQYYLYIFFYNVVYVIPLIIILLLFTFTLGKMKLSEWQGQRLKLLSGIMIFSFGVFFIIDYQLLENIATPIGLLGLSVLLTLVISYLWKRYKKEPEVKPVEEQPFKDKQ
jgi:thiol-disulfide isomerase/thioredoxin